MTPAQDGGPAFPTPDSIGPGGEPIAQGSNGMTLRDWFAGQVLNAELSADEGQPVQDVPAAYAALLARRAYAYADAMLAARRAP